MNYNIRMVSHGTFFKAEREDIFISILISTRINFSSFFHFFNFNIWKYRTTGLVSYLPSASVILKKRMCAYIWKKKEGGKKWIWIESKSARTGKWWPENNAVRNNFKRVGRASKVKQNSREQTTWTKLACIPARYIPFPWIKWNKIDGMRV